MIIAAATGGIMAQLTFQLVLVANQPYANEHILPNCSMKQALLEELGGFSRLDRAYPADIVRVWLPEVLLLVVASIAYAVCHKCHLINIAIKREIIYNENEIASRATTFTDHFCPLTNVVTKQQRHNNNNNNNNGLLLLANDELEEESRQHRGVDEILIDVEQARTSAAVIRHATKTTTTTTTSHSFNDYLAKYKQMQTGQGGAGGGGRNERTRFKRFVKILLPLLSQTSFLTLLFACAAMWPSLLSAPYFLLFLFLFTKWAFSSQIKRSQIVIKVGLLVYLALHLVACYLYQLDVVQARLSRPGELYARLLGLYDIFYTRCEQPAHVYMRTTIVWQQVTLPFVLLAFYWFIALEFSYLSARSNLDESFFMFQQMLVVANNNNNNTNNNTNNNNNNTTSSSAADQPSVTQPSANASKKRTTSIQQVNAPFHSFNSKQKQKTSTTTNTIISKSELLQKQPQQLQQQQQC